MSATHPPSSTGRSAIPRRRPSEIAKARSLSPRPARKSLCIMLSTESSSDPPAINALRMSPSVTVPISRLPSTAKRVIAPPDNALRAIRADLTSAFMSIKCRSINSQVAFFVVSHHFLHSIPSSYCDSIPFSSLTTITFSSTGSSTFTASPNDRISCTSS